MSSWKSLRKHHSYFYCLLLKKSFCVMVSDEQSYAGSLGSTSLGVGCTGTAGGGIFIARTASDSSSESSAAFLEKLILICEELREASEVTELDSVPLRRSTRSISSNLLTSGDRVVLSNEFCTVVVRNEAPSFSLLLFVTAVFTAEL